MDCKKILFMLLILSGAAFAQLETLDKNNKEKERIKSFGIKTVIEKGYYYRFGQLSEDSKLLKRTEYDKNGAQARAIFFDTAGLAYNRVINNYSKDGFSIERQYFLSDKRVSTVGYKYNEHGELISASYYEHDEKLNHTDEYKYEKGQITEVISRLKNDEITAKHLFRYNSEGRKKEQLEYNFEGNLLSKLVYSYNDKGYLIEQKGYDRNGYLTEKIVLKYDSLGNKTLVEWYEDENHKILSNKFSFDKNNLLIESVTLDGLDEPEYFVKFQYEYYDK